MAIELHTLINVEREPNDYHHLAEGQAAYSVHLSAAVVILDNEIFTDETIIKLYEVWLSDVSQLKFYLYGQPSPDDHASKQIKVITEKIEGSLDIDVNLLHPWFKEAKPVRSSESLEKDSALELDDSNSSNFKPSISDLLRSTASWVAPIPQRIGFTRIIKVNSTNVCYVVAAPNDLPVTEPLNTETDTNNGMVTFTVGQREIDRRTITIKIRTFPLPDKFDLPAILDTSGFLKVSGKADENYRIVRKLQDSAASALWAYPHLLTLDKVQAPGTENIQLLEKIHKENKPLWCRLITVITASALDPIIIALLMPGSKQSEGNLLAKLVNVGFQQLKESKDSDIHEHAAKLSALLRNRFVESLRTELRQQTKYLVSDNQQIRDDDVINGLINDLGLTDQDALYKTLKPQSDSSGLKYPSVAEVLTSMRNLHVSLQEESGIETCLIRILKKLFPSEERKEVPLAKMLSGGTEAIPEIILKKFLFQLFTAYQNILLDNYNGADAVRHSVGQVFLNLLNQSSDGTNGSPVELIQARLEGSNFFRLRVSGNIQDSSLKELLGSFWRPNLQETDLNAILKSLDASLNEVKHALFAHLDGTKISRFVPDAAPMPLPIQIPSNWDENKMHRFQEAFQGFGILIQRDTEGWRHACLTQIKREINNTVVFSETALHGLSLTSNDGQQTLFHEYNGFPLATPAFDFHDPNATPEQENLIHNFYTLHDIDTTEAAKVAPPKLAYGMKYQIAAFAITEAGSVPKEVRNSTELLPWKFVTSPADVPDNCISTIQYRRRTAIGKIDIRHPINASSSTRRIAANYPDVYPLSEDFPRLAVIATNGLSCFLDLYRNSDGSGGIDLKLINEQPLATLSLRDIQIWGGPIKLNLEVRAAIGKEADKLISKNKCINKITQDDQDDYRINIRPFGFPEPDPPQSGEIDIVLLEQENLPDAAWLRLSIISSVNAGLSFARPEVDKMDKSYSSFKMSPVLLLAPSSNNIWKSPFRDQFSADLILSRVSFLDFEHWISNPQRLNQIVPPGTLRKNLLNILMTAYVSRKYIPGIADLIEKLPDPAVSGLLISIEPLDKLSNVKLPPVVEFVEYQPFPDNFDKLPENHENWGQKNYEDFFKVIDEHLCWTLCFCCVNDLPTNVITVDGHKIKISLPEAVSVNLCIRPLVTSSLLSEMFDTRMKELVIGNYEKNGSSYYILPGTTITIETLSNGLINLIGNEESVILRQQLIKSIPVGTERAYNIVADFNAIGDVPMHWKCISDIECFTQRWRFSGRPIYNWIKPRNYKAKNDPEAAAIRICMDSKDESDKDKIGQFEKEIYYERDSADAASETKKIESYSAPTIIQRISWHEPSATWFRHRFRLLSRYRGAMLNGKDHVDAWSNSNNPLKAWTERVALLANPMGMQLTRPQLRALLPLTRNPSESIVNEQVISPPLTCINEERPFSVGGLSERVLAGIATGIGFGFEEIPADSNVKPLDLRREIGPDPRTSLRPLNEDLALTAGLSCEGPIGLHFDRAEVNAPSWSNSQYILQPVLLADNSSTIRPETFMGVHMLRMLDPDWVLEELQQAGEQLTLEPSYNWLIDSGEYDIAIRMNNQVIATVKKNDSYHVVEVSADVIDGSVGNNPMLSLCKAHTSQIKQLHILHQSLGEATGRLMVLAEYMTIDISQGRSNAPLLLASMNWKIKIEPKKDVPADTRLLMFEFTARTEISTEETKRPSARSVQLSATTSVQWARTAIPSNIVYYTASDDSGAYHYDMRKPIDVKNLLLQKTKDDKNNYNIVDFRSLKEILWLQPDDMPSQFPRSMHRHLVAVLTASSEGLGRYADVFADAQLITGFITDFVQNVVTLCSNVVTLCSKVGPDININGFRIAELQVPARALAYSPTSIPDAYRKPYFDTYALHPTEARCFHFFIRFIRRKSEVTETKPLPNLALFLEFQLDIIDTTDVPTNPPIMEVSLLSEDVRAIDIWVWQKSDDDPWNIVKRYRKWNGELSSLESESESVGNITVNHKKLLGFTLEMKDKNNAGELWADVSMLPSAQAFNKEYPDHFNFDWVFSSNGGKTDFAEAITTEELKNIREVAAQWVSLSPLIHSTSN